MVPTNPSLASKGSFSPIEGNHGKTMRNHVAGLVAMPSQWLDLVWFGLANRGDSSVTKG